MSDSAPLSRFAGVPAAPPGGTASLGRFALQRQLGQGAQASVWLGWDPRLQREVAIKLLAPMLGMQAPQLLEQWLGEARHVGRLAHPNIVRVFEADVQDGQPYIVFEYVPGGTLAERLQQQGRCAAHDAVALMAEVLDGLQAAHAAGIVHRDLKPTNIMLDAQGHAQVMDFGVAVTTANAAQAPVAGTPAYMAPEATKGALPAPSMDIYSAALVLVELLAGRPLMHQSDTWQGLYRIADDRIALPDDLGAGTDDGLRSILLRALAREPAQRYTSAADFRNALRAWATPAATAQAVGNATLDFLLLRMRRKSDFPALSDSVVRIQRVASSEDDSVGDLTREILKDVALTNKVLRLVNSALFAHANRGAVSTVSRAVSLVGFNAVRNMALSLVLLEHMQDKAHAEQMREEFLRAMMAGSVAAELGGRELAEESFIGAMFQNLGRMLCSFYFPEEAAQIRAAVASGTAEDAAALQVLGLGLEDLGVGVARTWGLPDALQRCMRAPLGAPPMRPPQQGGEGLRWLARAANEVAQAILHTDPGQLDARLLALAQAYARPLQQSPDAFAEAVQQARQRLVELARALELQVTPGSLAARLLRQPQAAAPEPPVDIFSAHELHAEPTVPMVATVVLDRSQAMAQAADVLAAGIQDITNAMVDEGFKLNDVLRMILETMLRALGARRILFALRDPRTDTLVGRFGLGEGSEAAAPALAVPLRNTADLFAAVCLRGADTLIADATQGQLRARLPGWYAQGLNAATFLLLPLQLKGRPFALIYADHDHAGALAVDDKVLGMLRTLRNQAVMAFRQRS